MNIITALFSGLLFGIGLIVSGMTNPAKIQNFLDIFGHWDPSLAFVMGGAIAITLPGYHYLKGKKAPLFADGFQWPTRTDIAPKLVLGSALFGIGWGASGFCPGPALTAVTSGATVSLNTLFFIVPMLIGLIVSKVYK